MKPRSSFPPVRAEVHADGVRAPYLRAGAGHPVVVLVPPGDAAPAWPAIAERIAERAADRCRIIAPEVAPEPAELDCWLRAFLDGLGVGGATLVVGATLADAARDFAAREPDRVASVAVLDAGGAPRDLLELLHICLEDAVEDAGQV